jgi:hypothetical protein
VCKLRVYVTNIVIHNNRPRFYIENDYMKASNVPENTNSHRCIDLNPEVGEFNGRLSNLERIISP